MITLDSIISRRRSGAAFQEIVDDILRAPHLLAEFSFRELLDRSGVDLDAGYLDMTNPRWDNLIVKNQIQYAKDYQEWFADHSGNRIEIQKPITRDIRIPMRLIPLGYFRTGPTDNRYLANIKQVMWCSKYQVTQEVFYAVTGRSPSRFRDINANHPVESVTWDECVDFCKETGLYLPMNFEWEYACRAGTTTSYNYGNGPKYLNSSAWSDKNSEWRTHPVGMLRANAWGLHDMHGNVWEWCYDSGDMNYDSDNPDILTYISARGGSFASPPEDCRSMSRINLSPTTWGGGIGFRVWARYP